LGYFTPRKTLAGGELAEAHATHDVFVCVELDLWVWLGWDARRQRGSPPAQATRWFVATVAKRRSRIGAMSVIEL